VKKKTKVIFVAVLIVAAAIIGYVVARSPWGAFAGILGIIGIKGGARAPSTPTLESLSPHAQSDIERAESTAVADGTAAGVAAGAAALHASAGGSSDPGGKSGGG
jgi:hypothetical protein